MAANTSHKVADSIQRSIHIPLLRIAEVTAQEVAKTGIPLWDF